MDRPCNDCGGVGCEGFCEESGRCDCSTCCADGTSYERIPSGRRLCQILYGEEPYCGACQTGGCIGNCKTATHLFSLKYGAESLSRVCSSRAEPLLEGDINRWAHLATQQERLEMLEELEVKLRGAPWDVDVSLSHVNSLRRDVESLSRVCGLGAEPFLYGDARRWKHLTTEQERVEKLEEMGAELQSANSGPETQLPLLSDEEIQRRLTPHSAAAPA